MLMFDMILTVKGKDQQETEENQKNLAQALEPVCGGGTDDMVVVCVV